MTDNNLAMYVIQDIGTLKYIYDSYLDSAIRYVANKKRIELEDGQVERVKELVKTALVKVWN